MNKEEDNKSHFLNSFGDGGFIPQDDEDDDVDYQLKKAKENSKTKSKTPVIDNFGRDLTKIAEEGGFDPIVGRKNEIDQLIRILNKRKKRNAVLCGPAGCGKTAIIEGLAQLIAKKEIDINFHDIRIVELSLTSIVSGTKYRGQFEERMEAIIDEAKKNPDVILFIDEFHTIMGAGNAGGSMDASNILKPSLARGEIVVVGATTYDEYQKHIEGDKALDRRFKAIKVSIPEKHETFEILSNIKHKYEQHHLVNFSDDIINKIINLSDRYIIDKNNPDKSIDLMDEVGSNIRIKNSPDIPEEILEADLDLKETIKNKKKAAKEQRYEDAAHYSDKEKELKLFIEDEKEKLSKSLGSENQKRIDVTEEDIAYVISKSTGIPITNLTEKESYRLLKMPEEIKKKMIDQDEAVDRVSKAIQRSRTGVADPKKPQLSALFLGSSGSGKCVTKDTKITIRNKNTGENETVSFEFFESLIK